MQALSAPSLVGPALPGPRPTVAALASLLPPAPGMLGPLAPISTLPGPLPPAPGMPGPLIPISALSGPELAVPDPAGPPPSTDRSLADLVEEVALGHGEAFCELYSRTSWKVFGLSNTIIRDASHAEEVTQEVFLEIWQRASSFDRSRGSASGFLMRLAHSRSVDRVRHTINSRARDGTYIRQEFRPDADCVVEDVVRHDEVRQLHAAVAGLTSLQREAITLTFLAGHTNRAASDMLGIPLSTLKTRVRDGVRALRCASPELVT